MTRISAAALLASAAFLLSYPAGAAAALQPDLASLAAVPRVELPAAALQKALEQPIKGRPYQFAVPVDLALAPAQGLWLARGETATWRLRLHSQGARSLSLRFDRPTLPADSTLWIYDPRGELVHGPYDAARIAPSGLWTPLVQGDELVVEIRAPAASADQVQLGKARAYHGFRDWKVTPTPGAGACNVDITCPEASAWTKDGASVARISIGGAFLCSGQLLNDVQQDQKLLFLTANHCGVDGDSGPASSVVFYFGYEGTCNDGISNPAPAPTFQGSRLLAGDVQSDFALLEITGLQQTNVTLYFAGWNATGVGSSSGVAIHHPSGDEKKIAFHTSPAAKSSVNIGASCAIDSWEVQWSKGTTEGGSSGAGLWNESHQLIGVLSGGTASCSNQNGSDYFGRIERGWTASSSASGQLKAHLDPNGTCVATVPGLDPVANPNPGPIAPTSENQKCEGPSSFCSTSRKSGGSLDWLTLLVLGGLSATRPGTRRQSPPPSPPAARA